MSAHSFASTPQVNARIGGRPDGCDLRRRQVGNLLHDGIFNTFVPSSAGAGRVPLSEVRRDTHSEDHIAALAGHPSGLPAYRKFRCDDSLISLAAARRAPGLHQVAVAQHSREERAGEREQQHAVQRLDTGYDA